ncbi:MAG: hypothetical protein Q7O66_16500 [Dehalococcoidia bacterium]|nr:hypothetical protein [Dehalococcoidia bacterium]
MVRASVAAEKVGIRSASIVARAFAVQARPVARALGVGDLALAEYPGVIDIDSEEEFREKVGKVVANQIIEGLAGPMVAATTLSEPGAREIVFAGNLEEVQEHFHQNFWSDGLPVMPPTIAKVEKFLRFTDRSPNEVIGTLLPEKREATVWNVAVNGVMAGCRPEYMPILVAIVEAMAEPEWRIEDGGSTPAWEPLVIVNGPIVKQLGFNYESGTMRVGWQSNTSVGRFARLCMRNLAGLRQTPGKSTDKGVIGFTFNVALAENEDAVAEVGWKPFGVEQGFAAGENVVTVQSVFSISPPIFVNTRNMGDALEVAHRLAEVWGEGDVAYWSSTGMYYGKWYPLLVVTPTVAKSLARAGWSKDDLKKYLYENVRIPAWKAEEGTGFHGNNYDLRQLVQEGRLSKEYFASPDPNRLVPVFRCPEWIGIVVSGDPEVFRARGYTSNHMQGPPVSKAIKLPASWQELLDESEKKAVVYVRSSGI